jgi:hypothetical protein
MKRLVIYKKEETVYKYIMKDFAEDMIKEGKIRIGTGYEYRKDDNKEIQDEDELTGLIRHNIDGTFSDNPAEGEKKLPDGLAPYFTMSNSSNIRIEGMKIKIAHQAADAYMYCVTKTPTKQMMEKFGKNVCIEISSMKDFSDVISKFFFSKGYIPSPGGILDDCIYNGRDILPGEGTDDFYWKKDPRFSPQDEQRLVLPVLLGKTDLVGIVHTIPDIRQFVKIHNF